MKDLRFDKGDVIFRQGSFASSMYDIAEGSVGIYSGFGTENEKLLARLGCGEMFGEMGLIEVYPRSATAIALEDGTVLSEITEDDLSGYFRNRPEKLLAILRTLSRRLRETTKNYLEACRAIYEDDLAEREEKPRTQDLEERLDHFAHRPFSRI